MKPVAIFRFARTEGPGHFATFLSTRGFEWILVRLDEGEAVPQDIHAFAGFGFMGGPMSANDELAWTQPVLRLMRRAVEARVPVIGHCLGGQLLARALGARVRRHDLMEIGWVPVRIEGGTAGERWFADTPERFTTFEWHEDTFDIPAGATRILTGETCANQAYELDGLHLGMQCHVEITAEMIEAWCRSGAGEIAANLGASPAVQDAATIKRLAARHLAPLSAIADRLYARWVGGLAGG